MAQKFHDVIELHFLPVGHTHFQVDGAIGAARTRWKCTDIISPDDFFHMIEASSSAPSREAGGRFANAVRVGSRSLYDFHGVWDGVDGEPPLVTFPSGIQKAALIRVGRDESEKVNVRYHARSGGEAFAQTENVLREGAEWPKDLFDSIYVKHKPILLVSNDRRQHLRSLLIGDVDSDAQKRFNAWLIDFEPLQDDNRISFRGQSRARAAERAKLRASIGDDSDESEENSATEPEISTSEEEPEIKRAKTALEETVDEQLTAQTREAHAGIKNTLRAAMQVSGKRKKRKPVHFDDYESE